jgi:4'-phosphopantetheinyl transferase EntD
MAIRYRSTIFLSQFRATFYSQQHRISVLLGPFFNCIIMPMVAIHFPTPPPLLAGAGSHGTWPVPADTASSCFFHHFVADRFQPENYLAAGIFCPPAVARSVASRQAEYFFGRLTAARALAALGLPRTDLRTGALGAPLWPQGVMGSISHTSRLAAAVALPAVGHYGIGIDLEDLVTAEALHSIASVAASPAENAYLHGLQHVLPLTVLYTLLFSAKESFYKAVAGTLQQVLDFDVIALKAIDSSRGCLHFSLTRTLHPHLLADATVVCRFSLVEPTTVLTSHLWRRPSTP